MNYLLLKNIIKGIISNFVCPECKKPTVESAITIERIENSKADILYQCPFCQSKTIMNAEMNQQILDNPSDIFWKLGTTGPWFSNSRTISEDEIKDIDKKLSEHTSINDLINGE